MHHRRETGEPYTEESHVGAGMHSAFETKMLDRFDSLIAPARQTAVQTIAVRSQVRSRGGDGDHPADESERDIDCTE